MVVSELTGIPWSMTLHRWDIYENNTLKLKAGKATFVRCISEKGKADLIKIIGEDFANKIHTIHLGTTLPAARCTPCRSTGDTFKIAVPANLYEVKGHHYLIEAIDTLVKKGQGHIRCVFYGDGYLRETLQHDIEQRGLTDHIFIHGVIGHGRLLEKYFRQEVDLVVLPSILTDSGHHEGIPVALIEAMAYAIPVVSTNTGSIPELIGDGSGLMVEPRDALALANAINQLIENADQYGVIAKKGRLKAEAGFELVANVSKMVELFVQHRYDAAGG
jgi:glycosyltransferase involved in cell wall biosynthesis